MKCKILSTIIKDFISENKLKENNLIIYDRFKVIIEDLKEVKK